MNGPDRTVRLALPDLEAELRTAPGVFGASAIDRGTYALLRNAPSPTAHTGVLDLGTGYGPIAVTLANRQPHAGIWAIDVDPRALAAARLNSQTLPNVQVAEPSAVPPALRFDQLYSNPPIKVGKDRMRELLLHWLGRLVPGSYGWLVVKQAMGADSLHRWLEHSGFPTVRAKSKQGYRILRVETDGTPPPPLTDEQLSTIGADTGESWTVLGRLAGGYTDNVHLVQSGGVRAVLKVKAGAWWKDQLERLPPVLNALRERGYPTPALIGAGTLSEEQSEERSYVLTEWTPGTTIEQPNAAQLAEIIAAAELHHDVQPPPERDWSAMVTLFLNGGIAEFEFHPTLMPYAERALAMVPKPVPALPTGAFVHGDFGAQNLLFDDGKLRSIIDIEGFGAGTPVIDLVLLAAGLDDPAHVRTVIDRALDIADTEIVLACLAHRVLGWLAWASEQTRFLDDAAIRAERLITIGAELS